MQKGFLYISEYINWSAQRAIQRVIYNDQKIWFFGFLFWSLIATRGGNNGKAEGVDVSMGTCTDIYIYTIVFTSL